MLVVSQRKLDAAQLTDFLGLYCFNLETAVGHAQVGSLPTSQQGIAGKSGRMVEQGVRSASHCACDTVSPCKARLPPGINTTIARRRWCIAILHEFPAIKLVNAY